MHYLCEKFYRPITVQHYISWGQLLSCVWLCSPMDCSTPSFPVHQAPPELAQESIKSIMSIKSVMPSNHLILCRPLLLPSIFPSIRVFSNESGLHTRWPKYQSSSYSVSPSNEYSGLISFRMDWVDLLAVQGDSRVFSDTIVQKHQFFSAQLSSWSSSHIHAWPLEKP